jgi:hypothetical protein
MVLDGEAVLGKQPQELVEPSCVSAPDFDVGIATRVHESSDDFDLVGVIDYPLDLLLGSFIELHELDDVSFIGSFVTKPANGPREAEILHATRSVHLSSLSQTQSCLFGSRERIRREPMASRSAWARIRTRQPMPSNTGSLLQRFADREGHAIVPATHVEQGYRLGAWIDEQRSAYARGELNAKRIARFEAVPGWTRTPLADTWERGFASLQGFVVREAHTLVPATHVEQFVVNSQASSAIEAPG